MLSHKVHRCPAVPCPASLLSPTFPGCPTHKTSLQSQASRHLCTTGLSSGHVKWKPCPECRPPGHCLYPHVGSLWGAAGPLSFILSCLHHMAPSHLHQFRMGLQGTDWGRRTRLLAAWSPAGGNQPMSRGQCCGLLRLRLQPSCNTCCWQVWY